MIDRTILRIICFFLVIAGVLVVVTVLAVRNINRSVATSDWVNHTHATISEAQDLLSAVHAGDSALRTYVITGDTRDQTAARSAWAEVAEHLEVVTALTRNDAGPRAQLATITPMVQRRIDAATELVTRRPAQSEAIAALQAIDSGGASLPEIARQIQNLKSDQMALLAEQDSQSFLQAQATRWTVWSGLALNVLLLAGVVWLIRDDLAARRRAALALETANQQLEEKVRERTAELVVVNEQLSTENLERQWANHALEHQLRYDRLIVDSIGDLVLVLTKVLNISRVNPPVVRVTGLEPPALINRPLSSIVRLTTKPGAGAPLIDPIAHALRSGHELRDAPAVVIDREGKEIPARLTFCPLRDSNKIVGGVTILNLQRKS